MTDSARILVIEDEPDLAHLVEVNLAIAGYQVEIAADGAAGLERARARRPALVLLDVMMPVMDGWQVLRSLKQDDELADVPVIMLTALSEERDLIRGHLQGAIRYLTKPFEMRTLLTAVEEGLREPDEKELAARRQRVRSLLQRLAELDSGRAGGSAVRLSGLEATPSRTPDVARVTEADRAKADRLTDKQRYVAAQLARGRSARGLAEDLGVSRSNVYATRKRIARKLGVPPEEVADEARRIGIAGGPTAAEGQ